MTVLIKLGGSLVTDKSEEKSYRRDVVINIARELLRLRSLQPDLRLLIGHGSGSYGHFEAKKHDTVNGVYSPEQWLGFGRVGAVATELSQLILSDFLDAGLPMMRFQLSSMAIANEKHLESVNASGLLLALERGLIPLVHGDIALDRAVGGTIISTEAFFVQLVEIMPVTTIVLLGEVDGVLDQRGAVIDNITPATFADIAAALGESRGIDVTGGMLQKVSEMVALVQKYADLKIFIANGKRDGVLADLLVGGRQVGTLISAQE